MPRYTTDREDGKALTYKTRKVKVIITSQKGSTARVIGSMVEGGPVDQQVKSTHFTKFPDGSNVECIVRVKEDGSYSIVSATLIDPDSRYQVFVIGFPYSAEYIVKLGNVLRDNMGFTEVEVAEVFSVLEKSTDGISDAIAPCSSALTYDEAVDWEVWFNENMPEATFQIHKARRDARRTMRTDATGSVLLNPIPTLEMPGEWVGSHYMSEDDRRIAGVIRNVFTLGGYLNVVSTGPSGYGKTTTFQAIAQWLGIDIIIVDCSVMQDTGEWFGFPEARDGNTLFIPTRLTELLMRGNVLVVLDEVNRIPPEISNSLFPLLDDRKATEIHNFNIVMGPGVVFAMTMNLGIKYAGTNVLDAAFQNRIDMWLKVGPLPQRVETALLEGMFPQLGSQVHDQIVALIGALRKTADKSMMDIDVSTRTLLKVSYSCSLGLTVDDAVRFVIINSANEDERKAIQDQVNIVLRSSGRP